MARHFSDGFGVLYADGVQVCRAEVAASLRARTRGLLGRDGIDGALLLTPATSVHTIGMRFGIDVAYLDRSLAVLSVAGMVPGRVGRPRLRARHVIETELGRCSDLGIGPGTRLRLQPD